MLRSTSRVLMRYGGKTGLESVSSNYASTIVKASESLEERFPELVEAKIQGSEAHASSKDPSDPKEVITVSYHTANGTRALSIHAHGDGTWVEFMSRFGKRVLDTLK